MVPFPLAFRSLAEGLAIRLFCCATTVFCYVNHFTCQTASLTQPGICLMEACSTYCISGNFQDQTEHHIKLPVLWIPNEKQFCVPTVCQAGHDSLRGHQYGGQYPSQADTSSYSNVHAIKPNLCSPDQKLIALFEGPGAL